MKRETALRYLRMGCGEGLFARKLLLSPRTAKMSGETAVKPGKRNTGEGRR